jgi:hypothetical protein
MGNHLKGCGCSQCRRDMHTKSGSKVLQKFMRSFRRAAKQVLRRGEEPPPTRSVGYTD